MKKKTIPLLLAVCFLILAMLLTGEKVSERGHTRGEPRTGQVSADGERSLPGDTRPARRKVHRTTVPAPPATHQYAQLKDFIIPELKLEETNFTQALHQLVNEYHRICRLTGEQPIMMKFDSRHASNHSFSLTLTNLSFTSMLKTLSSIARVTYERNENTLVFSPIKKHGHAFTRTYVAAPDIEAKLGITSSKTIDPLGPDALREPLFPTTTVSTRLKELLDIPGDGESIINYIPATGTLIVRADLSEIQRIGTLFEAYLSSPPAQVRVTSKVVCFDSKSIGENFPVPEAPTTMSDAELQQFFKTAAKTRGTGIMTMPSVLTRPGKEATIEVTREVIIPSPANPQQMTKDWTGVKMRIHPVLMGFGTMIRPSLDIGELAPSTTSVTHHRWGQQTFVTPENTMIYPYDDPEGRKLFLFVTHQEIDAAGQAVVRE